MSNPKAGREAAGGLTLARLIGYGCVALGAGVAALPLDGVLSAEQQWAAAFIVAAIGLWATQTLPDPLVALGFMTAVMVSGIAPAEAAFAGFTAGANWLVFAGIVIGLSVQHTGLSARFADRLLALAPSGYTASVVLIGTVAFALCFVIPSSMGRIVILVPIAAALAERQGFRDGDPARDGIVLVAGAATYFPCFGVLPAGLPNLIIYGGAEQLYGLTFTYMEWLVLMGPVTGGLKAVLVIAACLILFRPRRTGPGGEAPPAAAPPGAVGPAERRLVWVLGVTIALWALDFLHGVSPAWVGLAAAAILLIPGTRLVPEKSFKAMDLTPFFYVAGVLAIGAVVAETGLGAVTAEMLIRAIDPAPGADALNLAKLMALSFVFGVAFTIGAAPAVFTPVAGDLAAAMALPLDLVVLSQLVGISTMPFPYQGPPLVVAAMLGGVAMGPLLRFCLMQAALTAILVGPALIGWWMLLGRI